MALEKQLIHVEQFEQMLQHPDHQGRVLELIHGAVEEKLPSERHGEIAVNISAEIRAYLRKNRIGRVSVEARFKADELNSRLPDVAFRQTDGREWRCTRYANTCHRDQIAR